MCNHYEKNLLVIEWAIARVEGIECPPDLEVMADHVWPQRPAPVVLQEETKKVIANLRWGVWPFYAREKAQFVTNARSDGLLTKPTWKQSAAKRRCLIPAVGYFEPTGPKGATWEVRFAVRERPIFFIAGVWDRDPDGSGNRGFAMVTTEPNDYVSKFHNRMPVILEDRDAASWLGCEPMPDARLLELCRAPPAGVMRHTEQPRAGKIMKPDLKRGELDLDSPG